MPARPSTTETPTFTIIHGAMDWDQYLTLGCLAMNNFPRATLAAQIAATPGVSNECGSLQGHLGRTARSVHARLRTLNDSHPFSVTSTRQRSGIHQVHI
jgi:hypothetical protein